MSAQYHTLKINPTADNALQLQVSDELSCQYPMVTTLLAWSFRYGLPSELVKEAAGKITEFDVVWESILTEGASLSLFEFPPEILLTLPLSLEVQAAQIIINCAELTNRRINISIPASQTNTSIIINLARQILANASPLDAATNARFAKQIAVSENMENNEPNTIELRKLLPKDPSTSALLRFCFNIGLDNTDPITLGDFACLYRQQPKQSLINEQSDQLQRHYLNALFSHHDEITLDNAFFNTRSTDNEKLYGRLIFAYAHINCSLPFPILELDALTEECKAKGLLYWQAYLLTYGRIVRAYERKSDRVQERKRTAEALQLFEKLGDLVGITRALNARATLKLQDAKAEEALQILDRSLAIRRLLQAPKGIAKVLNSQAYVYSQTDQVDKAITRHQEAVELLQSAEEYSEMAFTENQLGWCFLLQNDFAEAVRYGEQALQTMTRHSIQTLPFRTKPDIHAQLGLAYALNANLIEAERHARICEANKIDSSASGEVLRTLLRALINQHKGEHHLATFSFNCVPDLLQDSSELDNHLEALYLRTRMHYEEQCGETQNAKILRVKGRDLCLQNGLNNSAEWFEVSAK